MTQEMEELKLSDDRVLQGCVEEECLNADCIVLSNKHSGDEQSSVNDKSSTEFVER